MKSRSPSPLVDAVLSFLRTHSRFLATSPSFLCCVSTHCHSSSRIVDATKTSQKSLYLHSNNDSRSFNGCSIEVTITAMKSTTSCSDNWVLFCSKKFGAHWGTFGIVVVDCGCASGSSRFLVFELFWVFNFC